MDEVTESDAMPAEQFWGLIDQSRLEHPEDMRAQGRALREQLARLSDEDLCAFCLRLEMVEARASCREHLWAAAYIIRCGCSDDSWMDFRKGLISRGSAVFEAAVLDPDSLAKLQLRGDEDWVRGGEAWLGLERAYTERTGKRIPHWGETVRQRIIADIPADDPQWDDEDDLAACCPRLYARHWRW